MTSASEVASDDHERSVAAGEPSVWLRWLTCLALALIALCVYRASLDHGFVTMDDYPYVVENEALHGGFTEAAVRWSFATLGNSESLAPFPLTWLSFALDVERQGLDPRGFHLTNILLHAANGVLLYLALLAFTGAQWRSALTAAVFALHPVHVESVAWVSERKDVLSGLFFMLTLWGWARFSKTGSRLAYAALLSAFILGVLAKSSLVTVPLLLLLLDLWPVRNRGGEVERPRLASLGATRVVVEKLPLFAVAAMAALATYLTGASSDALMTGNELSLAARTANASLSYVHYLRDSIWPFELAAFYPHPGENLSYGWAAASALLLVAITAVALVRFRSRPQILVGWLWFLGALVPMIGLVQAGPQARADRFLYLPQIGLCLAVFWSVADEWWQRRNVRIAAGCLAALWLAGLSLLTHRQLETWQSGITLFEHAHSVTAHSAFSRYSLGQAYLREGRLEEAEREFRTALAIHSKWVKPMIALGGVMVERGEGDHAARWYRKAVAARPDWLDLRVVFVDVLLDLGKARQAIPHLKKLLAAYDVADRADAHGTLGSAYLTLGNRVEAEAQFRSALEISPSFAGVHANLGMLLASRGDAGAALQHLSEALRLGANDAEVHLALSNLYLAAGRESEGLSALRAALEARPDWLVALNNLAFYLANVSDPSLRDPPAAVALARRAAIESGRKNPNVLETLAVTLEANGEVGEAARVLGEAIALASNSGDREFAARLRNQRRRLLGR